MESIHRIFKKSDFSVVGILVLLLIMLVGCSESDKALEQKIENLRSEISALEEQKDAIESEIINIKEEHGIAKYMVTFQIRQVHYTLDIEEHLKDAMNEISFEVLVDKDYYDSVFVGSIISEDFRVGSLMIRGTYGNWEVKVVEKRVV